MNAPKLNGIALATGLLVLVLGTATGNAYVMLAMAVTALVGLTIFHRHSRNWALILAGGVAALAAFALAFGVTLR